MKKVEQKNKSKSTNSNSSLKWNNPAMIVLSILSLVELGIWIYKIFQ